MLTVPHTGDTLPACCSCPRRWACSSVKPPCEPVCRLQDHRQRPNVEERHLGHQALPNVATRRSLNSIPISVDCHGVRQDTVRFRCRHRPFDDQHTKTLGSRVRFLSASRYSRHGRPNRNGTNDSNTKFNPAASKLVKDLIWSTSWRQACTAAAASPNIGMFGRFTSQTTQCRTSSNDQENGCSDANTFQIDRATDESMNGVRFRGSVSCVAPAVKETTNVPGGYRSNSFPMASMRMFFSLVQKAWCKYRAYLGDHRWIAGECLRHVCCASLLRVSHVDGG